MPAVEGKPSFVSGPRSIADVDEHSPWIGLDQRVEHGDEPGGHQARDDNSDEHSPLSSSEYPPENTDENDRSKDPCPDDNHVDDPRRHGVDAAKEI